MIYRYLMYSWRLWRVLAEFRAWSGRVPMWALLSQSLHWLTNPACRSMGKAASVLGNCAVYINTHQKRASRQFPPQAVWDMHGNACPKCRRDSQGNRWATLTLPLPSLAWILFCTAFFCGWTQTPFFFRNREKAALPPQHPVTANLTTK